MKSSTSTFLDMNWQEQAHQFLTEGKYSEVARLYEQAIATEPDVTSHYWHLGLAYLLQGYEEEAQVTWMSPMVEGKPEEVEEWTGELIQILEAEALRQISLNNLKLSWLIRQHIREIAPSFIKNLLHLIQVSIDLGDFIPENLTHWQVATFLHQVDSTQIDLDLLLQIIKTLLEFAVPETLDFVEASISHYSDSSGMFIEVIMPIAVRIAHKTHKPFLAARLAELCLSLNSKHPEALRHLSYFYTRASLHQQAIETARLFFNSCSSPIWQIQGSYSMLSALLKAGAWLEAEPALENHKLLIQNIVQNPPETLNPSYSSYILVSNFFLPYMEDRPQENRWLQNQAAHLFQNNFQTAHSAFIELPWKNQRQTDRPLKIGYIAHTLRNHSVGWLSRGLFQHYDRQAFQTHLYLIYQNLEDSQWFRERVDAVYDFGHDPHGIASKIKEDEIDILVDLDSLTLDTTCQVMALKPAPVQVTWLGWDAAGIPAIDYYIADPYVLPENAQEYYSETIWRLPQTYVAVDGFEVGVPTLRRDQLEIPLDAVVYFSSQTGLKRHPDAVRLQMQILKQVPNSYFLVKGLADETSIQQLFTQIAESEGVEPSRLRYLPTVAHESIHRGNLAIADIVLDTYPYNGATTTLETLWMGIPLVTRVGQQFSARNSYGFMMNVGVTEGIAWTDEEYVEWGVRLGKDTSLRQQIAWKLRQSRQTSPLWNAKQFTQEMEKAYKQMWANYCQ